jgi:hypothetical protein
MNNILRTSIIGVILLLCLPFSHATLLITGTMFNPEGADGGLEWVETYNPTNESSELSCQLLFGNGAVADDWTLQWEGNITVPAISHFLIGEEDVEPTPDAIASLNLQNGPDGLKLICDGIENLVGWGDSSYEEYYEGTPAIQGDEGFVLSRKFISLNDSLYALDTGNNSADFEYILRDAKTTTSTPDSDLLIKIGVKNMAPTIQAVENCSDDMPVTGIQILPSIQSNVTFKCDISASDPNGDDDIQTITMTLLRKGSVVREFTMPYIGIIEFEFTNDDVADDYILSIEISDGGENDETNIFLEYLPSIGLTIHPTILEWNDAIPGNTLSSKNVTVTNTGNTDVSITLANTFDDITFTTVWFGNNNLLNITQELVTPLAKDNYGMLGLAPMLQKRMKANTLSGMIQVGAMTVELP